MVCEFIKEKSVSIDSCISLFGITWTQRMSFLLTRVVGLESGIDIPGVNFSKTINKDTFVGHIWDPLEARWRNMGGIFRKLGGE